MLSVFAIGITVIQNYDKMRSMEEAMQETQSGQVSIQVSAPAGKSGDGGRIPERNQPGNTGDRQCRGNGQCGGRGDAGAGYDQ